MLVPTLVALDDHLKMFVGASASHVPQRGVPLKPTATLGLDKPWCYQGTPVLCFRHTFVKWAKSSMMAAGAA